MDAHLLPVSPTTTTAVQEQFNPRVKAAEFALGEPGSKQARKGGRKEKRETETDRNKVDKCCKLCRRQSLLRGVRGDRSELEVECFRLFIAAVN